MVSGVRLSDGSPAGNACTQLSTECSAMPSPIPRWCGSDFTPNAPPAGSACTQLSFACSAMSDSIPQWCGLDFIRMSHQKGRLRAFSLIEDARSFFACKTRKTNEKTTTVWIIGQHTAEGISCPLCAICRRGHLRRPEIVPIIRASRLYGGGEAFCLLPSLHIYE